MRRTILLALVLAGCPAPAIYREIQPGLSCERANRVAYRTMVQLGYTVTELQTAAPGKAGVVSGTKPQADGSTTTGRVVITCDATGAVLQPIEDAVLPDYDFSRAFGYSFKVLVQRPDVETPRVASGLQVLVQVIPAAQATLDLGGQAVAPGATLVRITVRNATDRPVVVDPARLELVTADGSAATALAGGALSAALVPGGAAQRVRGEAFAAGRVTAGQTRTGFLVFPAGQYREARLTIEDVETGEGEGFVAPVQ